MKTGFAPISLKEYVELYLKRNPGTSRLDNVLQVTDKEGHFDPEAEFAHTEENVAKLCQMGCEVVRVLHEHDQR
jgi:hypothetical protein